MFGGKRERELEEKLENVKKEIAGNCNVLREQSMHMTISREGMERNLTALEEKQSKLQELAKAEQENGKELYSAAVEIHNAVETFDANHAVFLGQIEEQNGKITELFEQHKALKEPFLQIADKKEEVSESQKTIDTAVKNMSDEAKTMGVLALNAAIAAGRLGEPGETFLQVIEQIRTACERHENAIGDLINYLTQAAEKQAQMEELTEQARQMEVKATELAMKLYSESAQKLVVYKSGQVSLREHMSKDVVAAADELQKTGEELIQLKEEIDTQIQALRSAAKAQKETEDGIEQIYRDLHQLDD